MPLFLIMQMAFEMSSQAISDSLATTNQDSIDYYVEIEDFESANYFIHNELRSNNRLSSGERIELKIQVFYNQLSLREYDELFKTIQHIDSLLIKGDSTLVAHDQLGLYYHKKGVAFYRKSLYDLAIESYEKAVYYRSINSNQHVLTLAKTLKNLGNAYFEKGDFVRAEKSFVNSIEHQLKQSNRDDRLLQSTYSILSYTCLEMNDLEEGKKYMQSSILLAEELYKDEEEVIARLYASDVFNYYLKSNNPSEMINAASKAIHIIENQPNKSNRSQLVLSDAYNNLAIAHQFLGDVKAAESYYLKAISLNGVSEDRVYHVIQNYLNLVSLFTDNNLYNKANHYIEDVRGLLSSELDSIAFGLYHYHRAELEWKQQKYIKSETSFENSLQYFNAFDNPNLETIKNGLPNYLEVLDDYSHLFIDQYEQSQELNYLYKFDSLYSKIDVGIQAVRSDVKSQESKLFLSSEVKKIYDRAIGVYYILFEKTANVDFVERAFEIIEKNKSLVILEELENRKLLLDAELPEELLSKIERLEKEMLQLNLQDQNNSDTSNVNERIIQVDLALDNLFKEISITYPQYERLKFNSESIQLSTAQKLASKENVVIVQYFLSEDYLYLMYIDEKEIEFSREQVDSVLTTNISTLRNHIDDSVDKVSFNYEERDKLFADFLLTSKQLYETLILPLESNLNGAQNIVIIPDKQLGYIPFDVLSASGSEADYLIHNYNISYAYSMGLYDWMVHTTHDSEVEKMIGFAPSFSESKTLSSLPFNKTEIEQIADVIALDSRVDDQATKDSFLELYKDYNIIHLSTHGIVDHVNPSRSYIAFSEVSDSLQLQNSLYASEIFSLNSKAELLVLSACETAIGEIAEGEGIMSLSRAWAATGVNSIISTLWRIDDQFTSDFMTQFYREMNAGESKSDALWKAKKAFLNHEVYQHPYYWASFTLMGDRGRLSFTNQTNYLKIGLLALGAILILPLFYSVCKRFF